MRGKTQMGIKSILLLVLCLYLSSCTMLEAEKPLESPVSKLRITFWSPFSGGDGQFMAALVQQFNAENQDHIKVEQINNNSGDYYTKLPTAIVTEEAPDVAIIHSSKYSQYVPAGFLNNIDSLALEAGVKWEDYNPAILKSTVINHQHFGIPLDTHMEVMYYNKKWLRQAGLLDEHEKPILSAGEAGFSDFLKKIQLKTPADIAPLAEPNVRIDALWLWYSMYNQMNIDGGRMYTDDGKTAAIDNPSALKSLQYVNSLYTSKLIPPNINDTVLTFSAGKAAVLITGVWATGTFEKIAGLDFGVTKMPLIYDHPAAWGDSHTFAIPYHKNQDKQKTIAAIKFANWVAEHGASWAKAGHIPAVTKAVESEEFQKMKYRPDYASSADDVKYFPNNPKQWKINDEIVREFEKMMAGQLSPQEVLQNAQRIINRNIQQ
jgi:multiple sugar transport system substrate-binding protein